MSEYVVVLKDNIGNYYTLTKDILKMACVVSPDHKSEIDGLMKDDPNALVELSINVAGKYERSKDPRIKQSFVEPALKALGLQRQDQNP